MPENETAIRSVTIMLTFAATQENVQERLRALMDAFVAAVPEPERQNANVSRHDPADVIVCLQRHGERFKVWHMPPMAATCAEHGCQDLPEYRHAAMVAENAGDRQEK